MMNAVTHILKNDATVGSLVGNNAAGDKKKVYPVIVPSSEIEPYITVRIVDKRRPAKGCDYEYTVQVTSYDLNYDDVVTLNNAVISAIEGQASGTVNGYSFGYLNFVTEQDEYMVDRIAITHEHPLYAKTTTFVGYGS